ncbi:MAG: radical SAM protein [Pseudobutyrivibrio sp.]|nr:radical SAM protein [Pseudobutyrivibrio sp.]
MSYMNMNEIGEKDFEKLDMLFEEVIPNAEEIWLFGNGKIARAFDKYLQICDVKINGHVVSDDIHRNSTENNTITLKEFKERYKKGKTKLFLTIDSCYYSEILPKLLFLEDDLIYLNKVWKQNVLDRCGDVENITIIVPVCDFCAGIKCYGCTVAAPLSKSGMYNFDDYKKDLMKLKNLCGDNIQHINFTGGDVFLHPKFVEFVEYARDLFPRVFFSCSTNGVLFNTQQDDVWRRLGKCNITLNWTLYPVKYKDIEATVEKIDKLSESQINLQIIGDALDEDKNSWKIPYTFKKQKKYDWLFCRFHKDGHQCLTMRDGKLACCFSMRRVKLLEDNFKGYFTEEFEQSTKNISLDLYEINDPEFLYEWMQQRLDICDYCSIRERKSLGKWVPSNCDVTEWFVE